LEQGFLEQRVRTPGAKILGIRSQDIAIWIGDLHFSLSLIFLSLLLAPKILTPKSKKHFDLTNFISIFEFIYAKWHY
jgi:hypothetical protein